MNLSINNPSLSINLNNKYLLYASFGSCIILFIVSFIAHLDCSGTTFSILSSLLVKLIICLSK